MKKLNLVLIIMIFIFSLSCDKDDEITKDSKFPIELTLKEKKDQLIFFKNGAEEIPDLKEKEIFYNSINETLEERDKALFDTSIEFLSETLLASNAFSDGLDKDNFEYLFKDGFLKVFDIDGVEFSIAEGTDNEIILRLIVVYSNEPQGGGLTSFFGVGTKKLIPLSFESTKDLHSFEKIEDIKGESSLYTFQREYIYKK